MRNDNWTSCHAWTDATVCTKIDRIEKTVKCPGVEVNSVTFSIVPRSNHLRGNLAFERHVFCPFFKDGPPWERQTSFWAMMDLVLENTRTGHVQAVDIFTCVKNSAAKLFTTYMGIQLRREVLINFHLRFS